MTTFDANSSAELLSANSLQVQKMLNMKKNFGILLKNLRSVENDIYRRKCSSLVEVKLEKDNQVCLVFIEHLSDRVLGPDCRDNSQQPNQDERPDREYGRGPHRPGP